MYVCFALWFFFFKQKTAYEMRISDWSSDVCSSDLPDLSIKLLIWDYALFYSVERELMPSLSLGWNTPPQVELCFDNTLPMAASHHQKIVVIDGALAFSGGLDLTIRR